MKTIVPLLFLLLICACDKPEPTAAVPNEASTYIEDLLVIMEKNSINRKTINWPVFKESVRLTARGGIVISDTYPAIKQALRELGDNHSFYRNGSISLSASAVNCNAPLVDVSRPDNIGYIKVNSFSGTAEESTSFARNIQGNIRLQDEAGVKGWIVDLRNNGGGTMWPMVAGLGPILGNGTCGYFIDPDNTEASWGYFQGQSRFNETPSITVSDPYTLRNPNAKVAVLIGPGTASSGEATAISFIGRANTKFFGSNTCGLSTANANFELSDKAVLYLTVSTMADRNKNKKGAAVVPDVTVAGDAEVVAKAVEWLNQP